MRKKIEFDLSTKDNIEMIFLHNVGGGYTIINITLLFAYPLIVKRMNKRKTIEL